MTYTGDLKKSDIVDWFIKSWESQQFPVELKIKTYSEFREFREFWILNEGLNLQDAIDFYLLKNEN